MALSQPYPDPDPDLHPDFQWTSTGFSIQSHAPDRRSKLVADRSWRTEREKTTALERELAFYQAQSATAMVRAVWRPSAMP